jgi:hypothetical protein
MRYGIKGIVSNTGMNVLPGCLGLEGAGVEVIDLFAKEKQKNRAEL